MSNFLIQINNIIYYIVLFFSRITGLETDLAGLVLLLIIWYLVLLFIFRKIHKSLLRKLIKAREDCTLEYDNIIYLISKEEYAKSQGNTFIPRHNPARAGLRGDVDVIPTTLDTSISNEMQKLKISKAVEYNPIADILNSKEKNYFANHNIIIQAIRNLETATNQILLNPETENKIQKLRKKIKNLNTIQKLFWIFLSLITVWVYLIFR